MNADEILRWLERPNCKVFKILAGGILDGGIATWERNGLLSEYYFAKATFNRENVDGLRFCSA